MTRLRVASFALALSLFAFAKAHAQEGAGPFIVPGGALDIRVSGYVETRMHFADRRVSQFGTRSAGNRQTVNFRNDQEVRFRATGLHDPTGVRYGAEMQIELDSSDRDTGTNADFDEAWLFFRGRFGDVRLGNEDDILDDLKLGAPTISAGSGGLDGDLFTAGLGVRIFDSSDATKIRYVSPKVAGFQLGGVYVPQTSAQGSDLVSSTERGFRNYGSIGGNYLQSFGEFTVGAFGGANTGNSNSETPGGNLAGYAFGGLFGYADTLAAGYWGTNGEGADDVWNLGVFHDFGLVALSFAYGRVNAVGSDDPYSFVFSADTPLLAGVSLQTDIAYTDARDLLRVGVERTNAVRGFEGLLEIRVGF